MDKMWDQICMDALGTPSDPTIARVLSSAVRGFALTRHLGARLASFTQERAFLVRLLTDWIDNSGGSEIRA